MQTHPPRGAARRAGPRGRSQHLPPPPPRRGVQARAARRLGSPGAALVTAANAAGVGDSLAPAGEPGERPAASPSLPRGEAEGLAPFLLQQHVSPCGTAPPVACFAVLLPAASGGEESGRARRRRAPIQRPPKPARCSQRGSPPRRSVSHRGARREPLGGAARPGEWPPLALPPCGGGALLMASARPAQPPSQARQWRRRLGRPPARPPWEVGQLRGEALSQCVLQEEAEQRLPFGWPQPQREPSRGRRGSFPTDVNTSPVQLLPKLILILKKLT